MDLKRIAKEGLRRGWAARAYISHRMMPNEMSAQLASLSDANGGAKFGDAVADLLARRPEAAIDIANQRLTAYQFLGHLGNLVRMFGIDFVIDAGAHSGQFASTLYGYGGYKGEVHSFEPVKAHFEKLSSFLHYYPGWHAYHCALGDVPGMTTINVGKGHGGTSSLLLQTENLANFVPDAVLGATEDIEVKRVDQLFSEQISNPARRPMLKLDVQGFEEHVLRGCGDLVKRFRLLQVEISTVQLYQGQSNFSTIPALLQQLGFVPIYVCNGFAIKKSLYLDYDFIFCRESELVSMRP